MVNHSGLCWQAQITWVLTIEASLVAVGVNFIGNTKGIIIKSNNMFVPAPPVAEVKPMKAMLEFRIAPVRSTVFVSL